MQDGCLQQREPTQELYNIAYSLNSKLHGFHFTESLFSHYSSLHSS